MSCKKCASKNQRRFKSETTFAFRELENLNQTPIYTCQDVAVCLDCGHLELDLPPAKLELLRQKAEEPCSPRSSGQDGAVGS
jgi:hypothetical protein